MALRRRMMRGCVALLAGTLLAGTSQTQASEPEICQQGTTANSTTTPTKQYCLLNPPTAAQPLGPFPTFRLRTPADVGDRIDVAWQGPGMLDRLYAGMQLLEQGPPGGTSLWQGTIEPWLGVDTSSIPRDGTLDLTVVAWNSLHETATFAGLPVLSLVSGINVAVRRQKRSYVAVYTATARGPAEARVRMYVSAKNKQGGYDFPGKMTERRTISAGGAIRVETKFSRRYVLKQCQRYRKCKLYGDGYLTMPGLVNGTNVALTSGLKIK